MLLQFPEPALGRTRSTRKNSVRVTESFGIGMSRVGIRGWLAALLLARSAPGSQGLMDEAMARMHGGMGPPP